MTHDIGNAKQQNQEVFSTLGRHLIRTFWGEIKIAISSILGNDISFTLESLALYKWDEKKLTQIQKNSTNYTTDSCKEHNHMEMEK